ncbi:PREDICTED: maltase A1-like [Papilio xuthus]|uniref:alpha-glucosidase n=1 Tax=Papilio xuthus TaxID=66420 RepID=A0AAJ6ZRT6_PAPXU|nr:PREDICTED: maltase A1-like [Papilio xuthus]
MMRFSFFLLNFLSGLFLTFFLTSADAIDHDWWQTALIYQIYPRSFKDSNGDGIGDLNGITEKLPYLKETGVDAIWMSPIFLSPMRDFGYDITDYREIAPEYGNMDHFQLLMKTAKKLGIRVILDFVPNHTSNESDWFLRSVRREPGYEDYYVWADGIPDPNKSGVQKPPSNWVSNFRGSAWQYSEERGQYYLHQFAIGQPDLNYREPRVHEEIKQVLRFWLDQGVSGFRVDAINMLFEARPEDFGGRYPDEPRTGIPGSSPDDYNYLKHIYTRNLKETYDVVYSWREILDEFTKMHGEHKLMMTEAYADVSDLVKYYGNGNRDGAVPFNFAFLGDIHNTSNAYDIKLVIDKWMTYMPSGKTANWVNGNHDQSRLASRHGSDRVDAMNMLALMLPGIAITYQGEELGMTDGYVSWQDTRDPQACDTDPQHYALSSRDPERTPYHWDASEHAGFSNTTGRTWLPLADNYLTLNLAKQLSGRSHYTFYKDLATIRKKPATRYGDLETKAISESILVVNRLLPGSPGIVGIVNLSDRDVVVNLSSLRLLPEKMAVVATGVDCSLDKGMPLSKANLPISAHCAVVFETLTNCC